MTTETEARPEADVSDSEALTPTSSVVLTSPSEREEETQATGEQGKEGTGEETKAESKPGTPESLEVAGPKLQARFDAKDVLTSDEKETLRRYQQAETDRRAALQARAAQQAAETKRFNDETAEMWQSLEKDSLDVFIAEAQAAREEGRDISPTLLRNNLNSLVSKTVSRAQAHFLLPAWRELATRVLAVTGDTLEAREIIQQQDIPSLAELYAGLREDKVKRMGPGEDFISKKEHERILKEEVRKEVDKLKAAEPERYSNTNGAGKGRAPLTYEQILKMSAAEIKKIPADEYLAVLNSQ